MTPERLQEIDEELASFGKSDAQLAAVVTRARALAAEAEGDLAELVEGLDAARAAAVASARADVKRATADLAPPPLAPQPPPPEEEEGSGLVEIPEELIRQESLPPVLDLNEHDRMSERPPPEPFAPESTDVHSAEDIERAIASSAPPPPTADGSSDIAGLSVDELFADAEPTASPSTTDSDGGLADLFDEEELRLSDPDGFQGLEGQLEPEFELGPRIGEDEEEATDLVSAEELAQFPLVGQERDDEEEEEESTMLFSVDELRDIQAETKGRAPEVESGDDFELLVDEDVLELDVDDAPVRSVPPPPPAAASSSDDDDDGEGESGKGGGGLISRILGRK